MIAGVLSLVAVLTIAKSSGFRTGGRPNSRPSPTASSPPPTGSAALAPDFAQLEKTLHASIGIAFGAVGSKQDPIVLGDWPGGPAWSTSKVPLVIAAYRAEQPPRVTDAMRAAITESDNAAAEALWAGLGDPVTAAHKVEEVLREAGDDTTVESKKVRAEYTAFGQTMWSLANQVRFVAFAVCDKRNAPIFDLMSEVAPDQSWGVGQIPGTQFKGGWGPSQTDQYLVRQIGVIKAPLGRVAVAIAAQAASGSFAAGTADLTAVAHWLAGRLRALPAGECGS